MKIIHPCVVPNIYESQNIYGAQNKLLLSVQWNWTDSIDFHFDQKINRHFVNIFFVLSCGIKVIQVWDYMIFVLVNHCMPLRFIVLLDGRRRVKIDRLHSVSYPQQHGFICFSFQKMLLCGICWGPSGQHNTNNVLNSQETRCPRF